MYKLWDFFYFSAIFFAVHMIRWLPLSLLTKALPPKVVSGIKARRGKPWKNLRPLPNCLWFHCASGEFEYAKPLIEAIKTKHAETRIVVTFFSPSVVPFLKNYPFVDEYLPSPWETKADYDLFFQTFQPQMLLVARTDYWPHMLNSCARHGIPCYLFSATGNSSNSKTKRLWQKWQLRKFNKIFVVSEKDQEYFANLGLSQKCVVAGDSRYDQVFRRLTETKELKIRPRYTRPLFVAGSTWPEDEKVIFSAFSHRKDQMKLVVVPHEPTRAHIDSICTQLDRRGLAPVLYSEISMWDGNGCLVVDEKGVLAHLYQYAEVAFIGGSFKSSVHSVMEALAAGCYCLVGPHHQNNREALEFKEVTLPALSDIRLVSEVRSIGECIEKLDQILPRVSPFTKKSVADQLVKKCGASQVILNELKLT